jgi:hypothetical protein
MSARTAAPSPPTERISDATISAASWRLEQIMTFAPSAANMKAIARPIPCEPPVTTATFPAWQPAITIRPLP